MHNQRDLDAIAVYVRQTNQYVACFVYEKQGMMYEEFWDPPTYDSVAFLHVYEKEGQGWNLAETRVDFWTRVEDFL